MAENPLPKFKRRPIRNFILLPDFQWPYIIRLLALINISGVIMATTISALYYYRYHGNPYGDPTGLDMAEQGFLDMLGDETLLDVIIPAFGIADVVSLALGLWLSLYFSRKLSVPIFRIKKWAEIVASGDLTFRLKFRPGDDLQALENACNQVSESYARAMEELKHQIREAKLAASTDTTSIKMQTQKSLP